MIVRLTSSINRLQVILLLLLLLLLGMKGASSEGSVVHNFDCIEYYKATWARKDFVKVFAKI